MTKAAHDAGLRRSARGDRQRYVKLSAAPVPPDPGPATVLRDYCLSHRQPQGR